MIPNIRSVHTMREGGREREKEREKEESAMAKTCAKSWLRLDPSQEARLNVGCFVFLQAREGEVGWKKNPTCTRPVQDPGDGLSRAQKAET